MIDRSPFVKNYAVARSYYEHVPAGDCEWFGVHPFGESGQAEVYYRHYEELRHLRRIVGFDRDKTVLELGSGTGRWILSLAPLVKSYTGVELSRKMLEIAQHRAKGMGIQNVIFCQSSLQEFVPEQLFDIIYFSGISQYLYDEDLKVVLKRLRASLKPSGVLIDRSTVHRHSRLILERDDYFSVYRTTEDIHQIFQSEGLISYYNQPSYRFLSVPRGLRRWVLTARFAQVTSRMAPISFHCLRFIAWVCGGLSYPRGEITDFSHDFFLFRCDAVGPKQ